MYHENVRVHNHRHKNKKIVPLTVVWKTMRSLEGEYVVLLTTAKIVFKTKVKGYQLILLQKCVNSLDLSA